ncbi:uncharacterized protein LOC125232323 [Leguminivora glycinivorella]|uniref:uncharacterized protein LOC125232323 n=1 Tax=Leguminivora glycinivorella TaxID=1035111 RepID=UPI00200F9D82|nr:uncharacterized protein LOC125232323 [Leguminivora glycinivorella]
MTDNITQRKKIPQTVTPADDDVVTPMDPLQSLSSEMSRLHETIAGLRVDLTTRLDELNSKLASYEQRISSLDTLEKENALLKATETEAQSHLRNELEISGLEETPGENPYHLAMTAAVKIGVELHDSDLSYVTRVGPKLRPQNIDDQDNETPLRRPLVVSFTRRVKRDEFLKQARARRSVKSKDIVGDLGSDRTVYVNERLTAEGRRLFRNARTFASDHGYKYCWVNHGTIFIRKKDANAGSPAIRINCDDDLNGLLRTANPPHPDSS